MIYVVKSQIYIGVLQNIFISLGRNTAVHLKSHLFSSHIFHHSESKDSNKECAKFCEYNIFRGKIEKRT